MFALLSKFTTTALGLQQVDIPVKYLGFFLEDDAELDHIKKVLV